jgi:hypothetical protein
VTISYFFLSKVLLNCAIILNYGSLSYPVICLYKEFRTEVRFQFFDEGISNLKIEQNAKTVILARKYLYKGQHIFFGGVDAQQITYSSCSNNKVCF